jgi:hypothetical protein
MSKQHPAAVPANPRENTMSDRNELARELFIADSFNQPREQSSIDWDWFENTERFRHRIEHYKAMADAMIAAGYRKVTA